LARTSAPAKNYCDRAFAGEPVAWTGSLGDATFECRLRPVADGRGGLAGIMGVAIDGTERKQAEDTRLALERRLLEAQKLESLGVLAGGIAHDFNNLLVSVLGNASLALGELPSHAPACEALRRIERAARRGSELTREMLAYAGKDTIALERVDVNAGVAATSDLRSVSIGRKGAMAYDPFLATRLRVGGLGPAPVPGVVRGHRGALAFTGAPGEGTTFRVYLPAAGAAARVEPPAAAGAPAPGEGREERTVLLVDDE